MSLIATTPRADVAVLDDEDGAAGFAALLDCAAQIVLPGSGPRLAVPRPRTPTAVVSAGCARLVDGLPAYGG